MMMILWALIIIVPVLILQAWIKSKSPRNYSNETRHRHRYGTMHDANHSLPFAGFSASDHNHSHSSNDCGPASSYDGGSCDSGGGDGGGGE